MATQYKKLRNKMSAEAQAEAEARAKTLMTEIPLHELRKARGLSQKMLADLLNVQQPAITKIEKRTDMYISTLRSHIEAMGGHLDVIANFPEGSVKISNFSGIDSSGDDNP